MKKSIAVLGSTGSIGVTTLRILQKKKNLFNIELLAANSNYKKISEQILRFKPKYFIIANELTFNKINNGMIIHRNAHNGIHSAKRSKHNLNIFPIQNIKKYNLKILNLWGKERNTLFKNTKIFINLHKKKHANFLETLRIHNLIYNRIIIISEPVSDQSDYLSSYVIYTNESFTKFL